MAINYRFRVRRRTAASWASLDEVLLDSEIGRETDTGRLKVGSGADAWSALPYLDDFTQSGTGAVTRTMQDKGRESVSVKDFGAVGDGVTDDTMSLQAAINYCATSGARLLAPPGVYTTGPLVITSDGLTIEGAGGHLRKTVLKGIGLTGPVLRIKGRSPMIRGVAIAASTARRAASVTDGHGILLADDDIAGAKIISRQALEDVCIYDQPTDGIHSINGCELSLYNGVTVSDCKRHGYVFDDGTTAGYANHVTAPFHWMLMNVRALECGGQGFVLGRPDQALLPQGLQAINLESLGCAWDAAARLSGYHYQVMSESKGATFINPDIEDQQYASSVTATGGHARTALAAPSAGIYQGRGRATFIAPYFSSLTKSLDVRASGVRVSWPQVFAGSYGVSQPIAIDVPVATTGVTVEAQSTDCTGATKIFQSLARNNRAMIDGKDYRTTTTSLGAFEVGADGTRERVITGAVLAQLDADFVSVVSETGTTDNMGKIGFIGAFDGARVTLRAKAGHVITVEDGATSGFNAGIVLKASPFILDGNAGDLLTLQYSAAAGLFYELYSVNP